MSQHTPHHPRVGAPPTGDRYDYDRLNHQMPPFTHGETGALGPWFWSGSQEDQRRRVYEYQAMMGYLLPFRAHGRATPAPMPTPTPLATPEPALIGAFGAPASASRPLLPPDPLGQYEDRLVHAMLGAKREGDVAAQGLGAVRQARRLLSGHYSLDEAQTRQAVERCVADLADLATRGGMARATQDAIAGASLAVAHVARGWDATPHEVTAHPTPALTLVPTDLPTDPGVE